jgi:hypothetical protein
MIALRYELRIRISCRKFPLKARCFPSRNKAKPMWVPKPLHAAQVNVGQRLTFEIARVLQAHRPSRGRFAFRASPALGELLPATGDSLAVSISFLCSRPERVLGV